MSEERYDAEVFALSLGFTAKRAAELGAINANATNIRRIAVNKGYIPDPAQKGKTEAGTAEAALLTAAVQAGTVYLHNPKHKHSYRKDGTCACGAVRKTGKTVMAQPPVEEFPPEE